MTLEKAKWYTIWMRTFAISLLAISYFYLNGATLFSTLGIVVAGLKLMETILFELSKPYVVPTKCNCHRTYPRCFECYPIGHPPTYAECLKEAEERVTRT